MQSGQAAICQHLPEPAQLSVGPRSVSQAGELTQINTNFFFHGLFLWQQHWVTTVRRAREATAVTAQEAN